MAVKVLNMNEIHKINNSAKMKGSAKNPPLLIHLTVVRQQTIKPKKTKKIIYL